jgi:hypothetical protein
MPLSAPAEAWCSTIGQSYLIANEIDAVIVPE